MSWSNFLKSLIQNSQLELVLLLSVLAWVLLRLFGAVGKRKERGNLRIELFGKEILEIREDSSSEVRRGGRGI